MIRNILITILLSIITMVLGGPFITKAMSNAIDMQLEMQLNQVENLSK